MTKEGNVLYLGMTTQEETAELLRLFLIQRKKLSISNLGSFEWVRIPAAFNEATESFSEPQEFFRFSGSADGHSEGLMAFLSSKWTISEQDADQKLTDWCSFIHEMLDNGEAFEWKDIGILILKDDQICLEQPPGKEVVSDQAIPIQSLEHAAVVSVENEEFIPETNRYWNIWMTLITLTAVAMIILYIYKNEHLGVGRSGIPQPAQSPTQYLLKSAS